MKKLIMYSVMGMMILGLTACGGNNNSTENVVQEEVPKYKELTDPRGKVLESTATGESNPKIVETLYPTTDVVIADYIPTEMGYAVDATGLTDSTEGIQKALYDCYYAGGGTVYLPAGNYAISDTIYIPPFVTLRGDWQDPDSSDFNGGYGTIISVWMEAEDEEIAGAFKMGGSAGALGLTVYYPLQSIECIMPYPYTFYVDGIGPNYMLSTIRNVTIINGYRGVGTSSSMPHEQLQIDNVKGTFLYYGMSLANSADVGVVKRFIVNNKYWVEASAECMNAVKKSAIDGYTKKYTTGLRLGDLEWTEFSDVSIDGCKIGIHTVQGERIQFAGSMYDVTITNCEQGIVTDGMDERWGTVLASSYIEGGIVSNKDGKIKLCDVEVVGGITGKKADSVIADEESQLGAYEINYERTYVKPASRLLVAELADGLYTDAGPDLQNAVDQMAADGGGVVYIPAGVYRFKTPIVVPEGVEVRGCSSVATRGQRISNNGTIFYCYYGDDASNGPDDEAFITLAGKNSGVNGIQIIYPENSPKTDDINTTYTIRGKASGVYVVNTMIAASAYGVDFRKCDNHYIEGVMTTCYDNAFYLGGKGGVITGSLQNGTVLVRTSATGLVNWVVEDEMFATLTDPILRKQCRYIQVEDASEQLIYNTFAYGVKTFVVNTNSENTRVINIGTDNLEDDSPQIQVAGGSLTGINIMRYNGYSNDLIEGTLELYNRIAINDVGEKTFIKSK